MHKTSQRKSLIFIELLVWCGLRIPHNLPQAQTYGSWLFSCVDSAIAAVGFKLRVGAEWLAKIIQQVA